MNLKIFGYVAGVFLMILGCLLFNLVTLISGFVVFLLALYLDVPPRVKEEKK